MQRREGAFFQALALPSHFLFLLLPSHFCPSISNAFSQHLFLLKYKKRKKIIEEKKNVEKGGSLPSSSCFALSLLAPVFNLMFLPFRFKHFFLGIFFISSKRKERKTQRKKTIEKKKNVE
jgi:hypothetical protein